LGCTAITTCRSTGGAIDLNHDTRHTPATVSTTTATGGWLVAFHGMRASATNVVLRPIDTSGTPGAESMVTSSLFFARGPSVAFVGASGLVAYEDDVPPIRLAARGVDASGAGTSSAQMVADASESPHGAIVAGLSATDFVVAWLAAQRLPLAAQSNHPGGTE